MNKIVAKLRVTSIDELLYFCYIKRSELYEVIKMSEIINNEIELQKNNELLQNSINQLTKTTKNITADRDLHKETLKTINFLRESFGTIETEMGLKQKVLDKAFQILRDTGQEGTLNYELQKIGININISN